MITGYSVTQASEDAQPAQQPARLRAPGPKHVGTNSSSINGNNSYSINSNNSYSINNS